MSQTISARTQNVTNTRSKVSQIINFLRGDRGPHSIHNIRARTRIDLQKAENVAIKLSLQSNPKVLVSGTTFEYQPTISGINNKDELRLYIQKKPQGVSEEDLSDAYVTAKSDIAKWVQTGRVVLFMNNDTKKHMLFWFFGRLRKHPIQLEKEKEKNKEKEKDNNNNDNNNNNNNNNNNRRNMDEPEEIIDNDVDKDLFKLISDSIIATWNDIRIPPTPEELQRQLEEVNLISGQFSKKRMRKNTERMFGHRKKKRKVNFNRMHITNKHMVDDEELKKQLLTQEKDKQQNDRELPTIE